MVSISHCTETFVRKFLAFDVTSSESTFLTQPLFLDAELGAAASMATSKSVESFRVAAKDYLNNDRFSDFTITCEGKKFKVHRCFICAHSKWFERCCEGMFEVSSWLVGSLISHLN